MSFVLEIEFLTGVCRAAREPGDDRPDWPPQPDRVFSALVSAWAARGERSEERAALEWLERQPPPSIRASSYSARTTPEVFVPPNDAKQSKAATKYLMVLPERRQRQGRRFPVARPDDPLVELIWQAPPEPLVLDALNSLASCVGYVGHSASLARCRFLIADRKRRGRNPIRAERRVYPGRLRELEEVHIARPERPVIRPGAPVLPERQSGSKASAEWLILEAVEGEVPDVRAAALVCRLLRQALMCGYRRAGRKDAIPEVVSGHDSDGKPTRNPHLAIVPMPFVGSTHADGRVFGFGLIRPGGESLARIEGLRAAFEAVAPYQAAEQRRVLTLHGSPLSGPLGLAPAAVDGARKRSLSPGPYVNESRVWASVTPMVMERHLKRWDEAEVRELVAHACENARLPRPDPERLQVGKHSMVAGAPPARPSTGEPPWTRWKVPDSLKSRQLVHVVIDFEQQVRGPVLLGAGRFTGLGLCRGVGR